MLQSNSGLLRLKTVLQHIRQVRRKYGFHSPLNGGAVIEEFYHGSIGEEHAALFVKLHNRIRRILRKPGHPLNISLRFPFHRQVATHNNSPDTLQALTSGPERRSDLNPGTVGSDVKAWSVSGLLLSVAT